ncbi:hypothetical protein VFPFJ_07444 [Purpureocillium lilacinum]|uniref:Uncharacterized protein n=1 Tax=Purpureocillium lilacinum TaxID=33203 RepID=A0A179GQQ5_PURLI|nr:hypothetical protein VFPFJ_07444 [Purpureocillium lilacinum]OAQ79621.1 hypothetical protein VFPBJ_05206 [Purpureocillium lilacinum]OAQ88979.1 hypothetical protein VFPFJ_07444 [Purpureocillium lilacinum]
MGNIGFRLCPWTDPAPWTSYFVLVHPHMAWRTCLTGITNKRRVQPHGLSSCLELSHEHHGDAAKARTEPAVLEVLRFKFKTRWRWTLLVRERQVPVAALGEQSAVALCHQRIPRNKGIT